MTDVAIPEGNIGWVQATYTTLLLDSIDAYMGQVDGSLSTVWTAWGQEQDLLWAPGFDLVTALGYTNVTLPYKRKAFDRLRGLYGQSLAVLKEAIRTKNLQLYITTRFAIEKQRQANYVGQQKSYQRSLKYSQEAAITRGEVELKQLEGDIAAERARLELAKEVIEQAERSLNLTVRLLATQGEVAVAGSRNELAQKRVTVALAKAALEVEIANIDAQKSSIRADVISAEIQTLEAQVQVVQADTTVESNRKFDLLADIATIQAQGREIEVLQAELALVQAETAAAILVSNTKQIAFSEVISEKQGALSALEGAQEADAGAEQTYAEQMKAAGDAQNGLALANDAAKLADEDGRASLSVAESGARMQELLDHAKLSSAESAVRVAELVGRSNLSAAELKGRMQELLDKARLDVAEASGRTSAVQDKSKLNTAEAKSRMTELMGRGRLDGAEHQAKMVELTSKANLSAVESAARMVEINDRAKLSGSENKAKITELVARLGLALAEASASSSRELGRHRAEMIMLFLENYVRDMETEMQFMAIADSASREAIRLDAEVKEAEAHKAAADIMKDATVENTITEVRG